ncbi:hypothetical protein [Parasitella parasitica]|uniref:Uncharacterized protein n=1 Tax=Parasitella parasitica TaxID=35722 RepID=A0A0B7NB26_9FUNG|nr:hypothetical protein [Parasitella parasitica]
MSITDLVCIERVCRSFQSFSLREIEKRIIKSNDEWGILIHLSQVDARPTRFDTTTKKAYYSVLMDPVKVKTMFDHRRLIHCSLLRKKSPRVQLYNENGFIITVEKGMREGRTQQLYIKNNVCQVHALLTRLPSYVNSTLDLPLHDYGALKPENLQLPAKIMAPLPLVYTLQITELSLPLTTIAA